VTGDWALAEDCAQDGFAAALACRVRIVELYERLLALEPSPVVELNRAIAVGMERGPDAELALLEQLDASGTLTQHYKRAIQLASAAADRALLERRLAEIGA
jgi:RNA polymerase sigma-70 factor (ECF subfamily)